ncbi:hypothetical protein L7F22_010389 [Adiantum nelumboides]|nr:hypothetical protein [Adiantum nelumboides]
MGPPWLQAAKEAICRPFSRRIQTATSTRTASISTPPACNRNIYTLPRSSTLLGQTYGSISIMVFSSEIISSVFSARPTPGLILLCSTASSSFYLRTLKMSPCNGSRMNHMAYQLRASCLWPDQQGHRENSQTWKAQGAAAVDAPDGTARAGRQQLGK